MSSLIFLNRATGCTSGVQLRTPTEPLQPNHVGAYGIGNYSDALRIYTHAMDLAIGLVPYAPNVAARTAEEEYKRAENRFWRYVDGDSSVFIFQPPNHIQKFIISKLHEAILGFSRAKYILSKSSVFYMDKSLTITLTPIEAMLVMSLLSRRYYSCDRINECLENETEARRETGKISLYVPNYRLKVGEIEVTPALIMDKMSPDVAVNLINTMLRLRSEMLDHLCDCYNVELDLSSSIPFDTGRHLFTPRPSVFYDIREPATPQQARLADVYILEMKMGILSRCKDGENENLDAMYEYRFGESIQSHGEQDTREMMSYPWSVKIRVLYYLINKHREYHQFVNRIVHATKNRDQQSIVLSKVVLLSLLARRVLDHQWDCLESSNLAQLFDDMSEDVQDTIEVFGDVSLTLQSITNIDDFNGVARIYRMIAQSRCDETENIAKQFFQE